LVSTRTSLYSAPQAGHRNVVAWVTGMAGLFASQFNVIQQSYAANVGRIAGCVAIPNRGINMRFSQKPIDARPNHKQTVAMIYLKLSLQKAAVIFE
jgi:hypothetical protein